GRFGGGQLADLVGGRDSAAIRRWRHHELPTYGRLKHLGRPHLLDFIQALIRQGYLRQEGLRYPVLSLTPEGREVMHDRVRATLGPWKRAAKKKGAKAPRYEAGVSSAPSAENAALREALRAWRLRKSQEIGIPPYALFWDRTLDELCRKRPRTPEELLEIWGIA